MDPVIHQTERANNKPTVIAAGTTGAVTINRRAGRVNMAAGASVLVTSTITQTLNIIAIGSNY